MAVSGHGLGGQARACLKGRWGTSGALEGSNNRFGAITTATKSARRAPGPRASATCIGPWHFRRRQHSVPVPPPARSRCKSGSSGRRGAAKIIPGDGPGQANSIVCGEFGSPGSSDQGCRALNKSRYCPSTAPSPRTRLNPKAEALGARRWPTPSAQTTAHAHGPFPRLAAEAPRPMEVPDPFGSNASMAAMAPRR